MIVKIRSNLKGIGERALGRRTYVCGANGRGKTALVQSVQLLTRGSADDIDGRNDVKDAGRLLTLAPLRGARGDVLNVLGWSDYGEKAAFVLTRENSDLGETKQQECRLLPESSDLMAEVNAILTGDPEKARTAVFQRVMTGLTRDDVVAALPEKLQSVYQDIADKQAGTEIERLVAVQTWLKDKIAGFSREKTAARKVIKNAKPSEPKPLLSEVEALEAQEAAEHTATAQATVQRAQEATRNAEARVAAVERNYEQEQAVRLQMRAQAECDLRAWEEHNAQLTAYGTTLTATHSQWMAEIARLSRERENVAKHVQGAAPVMAALLTAMDHALAEGVCPVDGYAVERALVEARRDWLRNIVAEREQDSRNAVIQADQALAAAQEMRVQLETAIQAVVAHCTAAQTNIATLRGQLA